MLLINVFLLTFALINASRQLKGDICLAEDIADTNIEDHTYYNSEPFGIQSDNAKILRKLNTKSDNECVKSCCDYEDCDSAYFIQNRCILFHCEPKDACKPRRMSDVGPKSLYFILTSFSNQTDDTTFRILEKKFDEDSPTCELSVADNCNSNEICKRIHESSRSGVCVCVAGFTKMPSGCVEDKIMKVEEPKIIVTTPHSNVEVIKQKKGRGIQDSGSTRLPETSSRSPSTARISQRTTTISRKVWGIKANAGPDLHILVSNPETSLYMEILSIYGSAIDKRGMIQTMGITYHWNRDPSSLSVGTIINDSDHKSTLMLTNLLQGQYVFVLTITDVDGFQSSDSVTLFATEKKYELYNSLVDVLLDTNVYKFTEQESINFSRRMAHVIEKNLPYNKCRVHIKSVTADRNNKTLITFYADAFDQNTKETQILSAGTLEEKLKVMLTMHKYIFDYPISKFQTRVCFNRCSNHGTCCPYSHRCLCNLPWMNNHWHERSTGFSNCDMHIMIIVVACLAAIFMLVLLFLSGRTFVRICRKRKLYGKEVLRYKLLDNAES